MGYQLGVDLGTTYSVAAVVRDAHIEVATLGVTAAAVPSVVSSAMTTTFSWATPHALRTLVGAGVIETWQRWVRVQTTDGMSGWVDALSLDPVG